MEAFWAAFVVVLLAEMGDKTQFVVMAFAAKYRWQQVFTGMSLGILIVHALAVAVGSFLGEYIPTGAMAVLAALIFLGFGCWTLKEASAAKTETEKLPATRYGPFFTVLLTFIIGEMGDKTQFATLTLAAQYESWLLVLLGAVSGMIFADSLGLLVGALLHSRLPEKKLQYFSGIIFLLFGIFGLGKAFLA